jgi:hypothetical protein
MGNLALQTNQTIGEVVQGGQGLAYVGMLFYFNLENLI